MSSYNLKFNKDDSAIRHLIIGLLADINKKIYYYEQISEDERKKVDIPFFYSMSGDEPFLYDYFLLDELADPDGKHAMSNYNSIPRGVLHFNALNISSGELVNKYNQGYYTKLENDQLKSYVAQFQAIPIIMTFDVEMTFDSRLHIFKAVEQAIRLLYKNNLFQVDVGHLEDGTYRVPCNYRMPEDYEQEYPIEFSFDDNKEYKAKFQIEMESFIVSFEKATERFAGNRMFAIDSNIIIGLDKRHKSSIVPKISMSGYYGK